MYSRDLCKLQDLAADQWGMVTVTQAESIGLSRIVLSRLCSKGVLQRIRQGVYSFSISAISTLDLLRAEWLALFPKLSYQQRLSNIENEAVVTGETAAWLHGDADFFPSPFEFSTLQSFQKNHLRIKKRTQKLARQNIVLIDGLPVLSLTATIEDLLNHSVDLDQVASFASAKSESLSAFSEMTEKLSVLAKNYPLTTAQFLERLIGPSIRKQLAEVSAVTEQINNLVTHSGFTDLEMSVVSETINRQRETTLAAEVADVQITKGLAELPSAVGAKLGEAVPTA